MISESNMINFFYLSTIIGKTKCAKSQNEKYIF